MKLDLLSMEHVQGGDDILGAYRSRSEVETGDHIRDDVSRQQRLRRSRRIRDGSGRNTDV